MPIRSLLSALGDHLGKFKGLIWLAIIALFLYAYWESKAPERERARVQEQRDRIGIDASVAGLTWASATRACRRVGVSDVYACAKHKGPLLADMSASVTADTAVSLRREYETLCLKHFEQEYCYSLLNRAYQIALSEPER